MGNVLAGSKPLSSVANQFLASSTPSLAVDDETKKEAEKLENPGTMEELNKKTKELMPMNFEGAKFVLQKGLSNYFQVSHTISLSRQLMQYRFGSTYVGSKQTAPNEAYPVLLADIDPQGNLNGNIIHQLTPAIKCKVATQIQNSKMTAFQMTTEYRGDNYSLAVTTANPNIVNGSGVLVAHYLQAVTNKLALGAEIAYQKGQAVPGGQMAIPSVAARYTNEDSVWSGTVGTAAIHVCYYQKASEQLQIGVELESSLKMQESTATIGYQIDLPKADLVFRGMVDTNWQVGAVLEKKLQPLPFTFALSGMLNHAKQDFKLGVGLFIG